MDIYLIRHGQVDERTSSDPSMARLTAEGLAQAERLAAQCAGWQVQFLCASTVARAQETADIIHASIPNVLRWDLEELAEINPDDLYGLLMAGPILAMWDAQQLRLGYERAWVRIMAAWARIEIYARANALDRIAIVAHESTITLLLLNWLGLDWRALDALTISVDPGATCKVTLDDDGHARIAWVNR